MTTAGAIDRLVRHSVINDLHIRSYPKEKALRSRDLLHLAGWRRARVWYDVSSYDTDPYMKIIDITAPLTESLPVWPNDPSPEIHLSRIEGEEGIIHVTSLRIGAHTGTHVDAPLHFLPDGGGVAGLDLGSLIGPALVVDVGDVPMIDPEVLDRVVGNRMADRLLFRSARNRGKLAQTTFFEEYTALSPDGARWIVSRGIRLVGIDYLSIGPFKGGNGDTHRTLLEHQVVIVEGLELGSVEPGEYVLVCLPLKLPYDGAPSRAVLLPKGTMV